jgi:hypothetical protein
MRRRISLSAGLDRDWRNFPSASSAQASIDRLEALQRLEVAIDVASPSHTASDGANIGTGDGLTRAVFLAPCREPRSA